MYTYRYIISFPQIQVNPLTLIYFSNSAFYLYFQIQLSKFSKYNFLCLLYSIFHVFPTNIINYTAVPHHNKSVLLDLSILSSLENVDVFFEGGSGGGFYFSLCHTKTSKTSECQRKSIMIGG